MSKKTIYILGGILALIIIVSAFIYFLGSKNNSSNTTLGNVVQNQIQDQTGQLPNTNQQTSNSNSATSGSSSDQQTAAPVGGIHKITDSPALVPALSFDGKSLWYFTAAGHLYKLNLSTGLKQEYLLPQRLQIADAIWPLAGDNFIVATGSGATRTFYYYDSSGRQFITYPSNLKGIDFMPDGKQIAYNWVSGIKSVFSIADSQAKNFQNIVALPSAGLTIKVSPLGTKAFAYDSANPQDGKLQYITFADKKIVTIGTSSENSAIWSPDGKHFIYNRNSDPKNKNNRLWLGDSEAVTNQDIHLSAAVSKVAFDKTGNYIYAAVPTVDALSESIWRVNAATLEKAEVFKPSDSDPKIDAGNLIVSADSQSLYFTNSDGYVYSVGLDVGK